MNFKTTQVIGLNTDLESAQVIVSQREGELFLGIIKLICDDAFTTGRNLLLSLADDFFEAEGNPGQKLTDIFKQAQEKLSKLGEYDLSLATLSKGGGSATKVLFLIKEGKVDIFLKRLGKFSPLTSEGLSGQLISGFLSDYDRVIFATHNLTSFLKDDLTSIMSLSLEEWEEAVNSKTLGSGFADGGFAAMLLEADPEKVEIPTLVDSQESEKTPGLSLLSRISLSRVNLRKIFPKSGRGRLILAVLLILFLLIGLGIQYQRVSSGEKDRLFNQNLDLARSDFAEASSLQNLNPLEAKNKLDEALASINKALSYKNEKSALELKEKIEQAKNNILQEHKSQNELFLDLNLVKEGFSAKNLSLSDGNLLLLDPNSSTLISLKLSSKSHQILAGESKLASAKYASINGDFAFVYSSKGILKVDIPTQKVTEAEALDSNWGEIIDLAGFASNIYLLDKGKNQIWKILATSSGYSSSREYLTKETKVDLAKAAKMQIESSVYILKEGGDILRFTRGAPDHFSIGGLDKAIKDPKSFFTSSETDNLYILDSGNSRIVVVNKTGGYIAQYQNDSLGGVTDLVVDEKGKKIYLLEGSKIYSLDLK